MTKRNRIKRRYPVQFGEVTYGPEVPADEPRWVWACACRKCKKIPVMDRLHGPFKTEQKAAADAERFFSEAYGEKGFLQTEEATLRVVEENGEPVLYLDKDHKTIAKRYSGQSWIVLEPGYKVSGNEPGTQYGKLVIEFDSHAATQAH
jgi:hypothetical protein